MFETCCELIGGVVHDSKGDTLNDDTLSSSRELLPPKFGAFCCFPSLPRATRDRRPIETISQLPLDRV